MTKCKCKYYLRNEDGVLVCVQCGEPAKPRDKTKAQVQADKEAQGLREKAEREAAAKEEADAKAKQPRKVIVQTEAGVEVVTEENHAGQD